MLTTVLWIGAYLFGAGCASALRAFYIEKPEDSWGRGDWAIGNAMLPMVWPVYLPILGGYIIGSVAKRVQALLDDQGDAS